MSSNKKLNWWDALSIIAAIGTFGLGWIADNLATVIAFSAVGLVWLINLGLRHFGWKPSKAGLTVIVFAVALGLSFLSNPAVFPEFPAWSGDASAFAPLLIAYLSALLQVAAGVVSYATGVYNILLAKVLEKLPANILGTAVSILPIVILVGFYMLLM